jgi:N,N'-diacetylchitobiose transport system permease protein
MQLNASVKKNSIPTAKRMRNLGFSVIGVIVFICSAFPIYWMINSSFLPYDKIRTQNPVFFPGPGDFTGGNYEKVVVDPGNILPAKFLPALSNSLQVTFFTLVVSLVVAFLASVAIGRYAFKGRKGFIVAILIVQMIPGEALMLTLYRMMDGFHLTENILGLGLIYISTVLPFTVWTLRGFVAAVPAELEESAMIDGCTRASAFWRVTFPLLAPGLVSTGVFAFIQAWNEFVMALVMMNSPEHMTLPMWLRSFLNASKGMTDWGGMMAGSVLVSIPVVIFFLIVQGRMTGGLTAGAVKG